jgi:hypothetical protein
MSFVLDDDVGGQGDLPAEDSGGGFVLDPVSPSPGISQKQFQQINDELVNRAMWPQRVFDQMMDMGRVTPTKSWGETAAETLPTMEKPGTMLDPYVRGFREAVSGANRTIANLGGLAEKLTPDAVNPTVLSRVGKYLKDTFNTQAEAWAPEAQPDQALLSKILQGLTSGAFSIPEVATFMKYLGPIAGMAGHGALKGSDKGAGGAAMGALEGGAMGAMFPVTAPLKPLLRGLTVGGAASAQAAASGAPLEDVIAAGATMGPMAGFGHKAGVGTEFFPRRERPQVQTNSGPVELPAGVPDSSAEALSWLAKMSPDQSAPFVRDIQRFFPEMNNFEAGNFRRAYYDVMRSAAEYDAQTRAESLRRNPPPVDLRSIDRTGSPSGGFVLDPVYPSSDRGVHDFDAGVEQLRGTPALPEPVNPELTGGPNPGRIAGPTERFSPELAQELQNQSKALPELENPNITRGENPGTMAGPYSRFTPEPPYITAARNRPFETERGAANAMRIKKLDPAKYDIVTAESVGIDWTDGFVLKRKPNLPPSGPSGGAPEVSAAPERGPARPASLEAEQEIPEDKVLYFPDEQSAKDYILSRRMQKDNTLFETTVDPKTGEAVVRNNNFLRRDHTPAVIERAADLKKASAPGVSEPVETPPVASEGTDLLASRQPKTEPTRGAETDLFLPGNRTVRATWGLMERGDLLKSHDTELHRNHLYPQDLQPRDRGERVAYLEQVGNIARNLSGEQLGHSPYPNYGAPSVTSNGVVVAGNGRLVAMDKAHRDAPEQAAKYREWLGQNAKQFGIDPGKMDSMHDPVLVRMLPQDMSRTDLVRFAEDANKERIQSMSASEKARMDARIIDDNLMRIYAPDEQGSLTAASNTRFIQEFMRRMTPEERGGLTTEEGGLSADGIRRVKQAMFAKAYGDSESLNRMAEDPSDNVRNVTNGMVSAAGQVAGLKARMAEGIVDTEMDFTPDLTAAASKLADLRDRGMSYQDYARQVDLFDTTSDYTKRLTGLLVEYSRSGKKIGELIRNLSGETARLGSKDFQLNFLGDDGAGGRLTKAEILESVARGMEELYGRNSESHTLDLGGDTENPGRGNGGYNQEGNAPPEFGQNRPGAEGQTPSETDLPQRNGPLGPGEGPTNLYAGLHPEMAKALMDQVGRQATKAMRYNGLDHVKNFLSPSSASAEALSAALTLGEKLSRSARNEEIAYETMQGAQKALDKMGRDFNIEYQKAMQAGTAGEIPGMAGFAEVIRKTLDEARDRVKALGTGKLEKFYQNYFPQIWEKPDIFNEMVDQGDISFHPSNFEGSKNFLHKKVFETIQAGLDHGLKLKHENAVDASMFKIREMQRYVVAHEAMQEFLGRGLVEKVRTSESRQQIKGWVKLNDPIGTDWAVKETKGDIPGDPLTKKELVKTAEYYAHPDVARILNQHLSAGLRGMLPVYDFWMKAGNLLNQAQLLGFFHAGFTSLDAAISKNALAWQYLADGKPIQFVKNFLETPLAPLTTILKGNKLYKEWFAPGKMGEDIGVVLESLISGGGRAKMDNIYVTDMWRSMKRDFYSGEIGRMAKGALKAPFALVEQVSKPLMSWVVPRQKLGIAMDMIQRELAKEGYENLTRDQVREKMSKVVDSVDNRMGQMIYDRLFWNKMFKDVAMASVRSVGWNIGTVREVGGGVVDTVRQIGNIVQGRKPEMTNRMAYNMGMTIVTGMIGGIMHKLYTGENPSEVKDYFFPWDGTYDERGLKNRRSLPSYVKDVVHYATDPVKTVTNKLHPLAGLIKEVTPVMINIAAGTSLKNSDFYNVQIANPEDSRLEQTADLVKHTGKSFLPFGVRDTMKSLEMGKEGSSQYLLPQVGVTQANSSIKMNPGEAKVMELTQHLMPKGPEKQETWEKRQLKAQIGFQFRNKGEIPQKGIDAVLSGKLTEDELVKVLEGTQDNGLAGRFRRLGDLEDVVVALRAMNPQQRLEMLPEVLKKFDKLDASKLQHLKPRVLQELMTYIQ